MSRAVAVEPVKEINGTSGWPTSASPALGPVPNTMLTTPGGTPAETDKFTYLFVFKWIGVALWVM